MLDGRLTSNYLFDSLKYWLVRTLQNWLILHLFQLFRGLLSAAFLVALRAQEVSIVVAKELLAVVAEHGGCVVLRFHWDWSVVKFGKLFILYSVV